MMENKESFLSKIVGLYKTLKGTVAHYFLVMENLFKFEIASVKPTTVFDLKGAIVNRKSKPGAKVKLDVDWIEKNEKLELEEAQAEKMLNQIHKDAVFLKENNLMDYSLLLGIHEFEEGVDLKEIEKDMVPNKHFFDHSRKRFVFLSIIDFTQVYDGKKKVAHFLKKIVHSSHLLSTIRSDPYCSRFIQFIHHKVLHLGDSILQEAGSPTNNHLEN